MQYYDFTKEQSDEAIKLYREHYKQYGINAYVAYPGILGLLKELKLSSAILGVVTGKIDQFARIALESTHLIEYFDFVCATDPNHVVTKTVTLAEALEKMPDISLESVVMIGDREHDIIAANDNGIDSIGVLYGYGTTEEFVDNKATQIVENVDDLKSFLLS
jgi:phosphoglycolate phosphatase